MSDSAADMTQIEQLARIQQMIADTNLKTAQANTTMASVGFAGFIAGAAVIGAVVALMKVLGH